MMKLRLILLTGTLCLLPVVAMGQSEGQAELQPVGPTLNIKIHLAGAMNTADLFLTEAGHRYRIRYFDGSTELLTPEQFAQRIYRDHSSRSWLDRVLNITSPVGFAWVLVGLLGQVLFTGRMVLQWLVSEKENAPSFPRCSGGCPSAARACSSSTSSGERTSSACSASRPAGSSTSATSG
jgi:hypothetical protein